VGFLLADNFLARDLIRPSATFSKGEGCKKFYSEHNFTLLPWRRCPEGADEVPLLETQPF
jgi:hypothetical protein